MCHLPFDADLDNAGPMVKGRDDHITDKAQKPCTEMALTIENAPAATEAGFETKLSRNYKRLPPYGKQLMDIRQAGKVPPRKVIVTFDWKRALFYPRIVILADANPTELEFKYLAGIPVEIIYHSKDAHRVDALVQEITRVNPCCLKTLALDLIDTDDGRTFIKRCKCAEQWQRHEN